MALPCQVRMRDDGRLLGFRFDDSVAPQARNWVRAQVAAFRFEVERSDARTWEREEEDPTGVAGVQYQREDGSGDADLRLRRKKLAYTPRSADAGGVTVALRPEVDGEATGLLSASLGWLQEAELRERLVVAAEGLGVATTVEQEGSLRLASHSRRPLEQLPAVDWETP